MPKELKLTEACFLAGAALETVFGISALRETDPHLFNMNMWAMILTFASAMNVYIQTEFMAGRNPFPPTERQPSAPVQTSSAQNQAILEAAAYFASNSYLARAGINDVHTE